MQSSNYSKTVSQRSTVNFLIGACPHPGAAAYHSTTLVSGVMGVGERETVLLTE